MSQTSPPPRSGDAPNAPAGAASAASAGDPPIDPARRRRSRLQLLAIVSAFAVPLLLAILWLRVVESGGAGDLGVTSRGELIRPAVPLEAFTLLDGAEESVDLETLRGLWTMLYLPAGECGDICQRNLYYMRQVRLALNQRMTRVQRMVVPAEPLPAPLVAEHPGLIVASGDAEARARLVGQVDAAQGGLTPAEDAIFLVDPFGNLMMRFPPDLPPESMLKDIKHLLKVSKIG